MAEVSFPVLVSPANAKTKETSASRENFCKRNSNSKIDSDEGHHTLNFPWQHETFFGFDSSFLGCSFQI